MNHIKDLFFNNKSTNKIYIDPTFTGWPQIGTIENPLTGMPSTNDMTPNTTYLFKRGTTYSHSNKINIQVYGVTLAAYGIGTMPIINQTTNNDNIIGAGSLIVKDLELIAPSGANDSYQLSFADAGGYLHINNCKIHGGGQGIRIMRSPNMSVKIKNSEIHDCWSDGIFIQTVNDLEVSYCNIYDVNTSYPNLPNDGDCIHLDNINNIWIHHNVLNHSSQPGKFCLIIAILTFGFTGNAIIEYNTLIRDRNQIDSTVFYSDYSHGGNIIFRYNKIKNALVGIQSLTYDMKVYGNTFNNINQVYLCNAPYDYNSYPVFYNNTCYNCGDIIYGFGEFVDVKNCILHTITNVAFTGSHITVDYNDYYNVFNFGDSIMNIHDIITDPMFIDINTENFVLQNNSPCKGTGVQIPGFYESIVDRGSGLATFN